MNDNLFVSDLLELAILNEQDGYAFYTVSAKKLNDEKLISFFHFLAEEELKHQKYLKDMKNRLDTFAAKESLPRSYDASLKTYMNSLAPGKDKALEAQVDQVSNVEDALKIALDFERNSVIYYAILKTIAHPDLYPMLDEIIKEEVKHVLKINHYKETGIPEMEDRDAT